MEIIKWANDKGFTLILSEKEAEGLEDAIRTALLTGKGESETIDVEVKGD